MPQKIRFSLTLKFASVANGMQMISPLPSEDAWDAYNKSYFINAHGV